MAVIGQGYSSPRGAVHPEAYTRRPCGPARIVVALVAAVRPTAATPPARPSGRAGQGDVETEPRTVAAFARVDVEDGIRAVIDAMPVRRPSQVERPAQHPTRLDRDPERPTASLPVHAEDGDATLRSPRGGHHMPGIERFRAAARTRRHAATRSLRTLLSGRLERTATRDGASTSGKRQASATSRCAEQSACRWNGPAVNGTRRPTDPIGLDASAPALGRDPFCQVTQSRRRSAVGRRGTPG